jgi:hypothetical protein
MMGGGMAKEPYSKKAVNAKKPVNLRNLRI